MANKKQTPPTRRISIDPYDPGALLEIIVELERRREAKIERGWQALVAPLAQQLEALAAKVDAAQPATLAGLETLVAGAVREEFQAFWTTTGLGLEGRISQLEEGIKRFNEQATVPTVPSVPSETGNELEESVDGDASDEPGGTGKPGADGASGGGDAGAKDAAHPPGVTNGADLRGSEPV